MLPLSPRIFIASGLLALAADPAAVTETPAPCEVHRLLIADLTGDNQPEIVTGCNRSLAVYRPVGRARLQLLSQTETRGNVTELVAGKFDADAHPDVAFADHDTFGLWLLRGDGQGGLAPLGLTRVQRTGRPHVHGLLAGDWNRDGRLDTLHFNVNAGAVPLSGDGRGEQSPGSLIPIHSPNNPVAADLNGDGHLDFAVASVQNKSVAVFLGDARGGFSPAPGSPIRVADRPYYVAAGDLNGDGRLDLAVTHDDTDLLTVLYGSGGGAFESPHEIHLGDSGFGVRILDLNRDGRMDIAAANGRQYFWIPQTASHRLGPVQRIPHAQTHNWTFAAGDLDGDSFPDLVSYISTTHSLTVHWSPGRP
jgi:hypothetical protein